MTAVAIAVCLSESEINAVPVLEVNMSGTKKKGVHLLDFRYSSFCIN